MFEKIGFIGTGNMGSALARAVRKSVAPDQLLLADYSETKALALARELGCKSADNKTIAAEANFIFLGVKPQNIELVLAGIAPILAARNDRFVLVTMAVGIPLSKYNNILGRQYPVIRIMPNTPVSVGEGVILYTPNDSVYVDEITDFCEILKFAGLVDRIDENLIDAASALSGCGPAFVYMFAEALADGGVECGLPRTKALEYAAKTIGGAAKLMSVSGKHPAQLKDDVCSPGGTTIAGVHTLENSSFRAAAMGAVKSAFDKTKSIK